MYVVIVFLFNFVLYFCMWAWTLLNCAFIGMLVWFLERINRNSWRKYKICCFNFYMHAIFPSVSPCIYLVCYIVFHLTSTNSQPAKEQKALACRKALPIRLHDGISSTMMLCVSLTYAWWNDFRKVYIVTILFSLSITPKTCSSSTFTVAFHNKTIHSFLSSGYISRILYYISVYPRNKACFTVYFV